jgi:tRNA/rRNA methyltransferase
MRRDAASQCGCRASLHGHATVRDTATSARIGRLPGGAAPYIPRTMAGTNTTAEPVWSPEGPAFVLVRPQMGENIGAAARAMWNFGLRGLRLVAPRDGWPNPAAVAMASGAGSLLDEAPVSATTQDAVADCHYVYATTARPRELTKPVLTPEEAVADMGRRAARGEKLAILFGPERTGLENEDVVLANAIITVPTNPAFASINLAQSTVLMAYEWRRQAVAAPPPAPSPSPPATSEAVGHLLDHLTEALEAAHYFYPADKGPAMKAHLDNIFRRAPLTEQDVRSLRGAIRALEQGRPRRVRATARAGRITSMEALRAGIDALDEQLLDLFAMREAHIERAAELKQQNGWPARIPDRVEEVVAHVRRGAEARGLDPALFDALWRRIIDRAIALEEERMGRP